MAELTLGRQTASRPADLTEMGKFLWVLGSLRDPILESHPDSPDPNSLNPRPSAHFNRFDASHAA